MTQGYPMTVKGKKSERDAFAARWLWALQNNIAAGNLKDAKTIVDALARKFNGKPAARS